MPEQEEIIQQFKYDLSDYASKTMHGLKVHKGHRHKEDQLTEILCDESLDNSMGISFFSEERKEITSSTPAKPAVSGGLNREGKPASLEEWREMFSEVFHLK